MEARQLLYTMDEFERIADSAENRDRLLELIDGEIVEKEVSQLHALYIGNVLDVSALTFSKIVMAAL